MTADRFDDVYHILLENELKIINKYNDTQKRYLKEFLKVDSLDNWSIMDRVYDFVKYNYPNRRMVAFEAPKDKYRNTAFKHNVVSLDNFYYIISNKYTTRMSGEDVLGVLVPFHVGAGEHRMQLCTYIMRPDL